MEICSGRKMSEGEYRYGKCLRVNVDITKGMQLLIGKKRNVSKVDPCGACVERVGGFIVVILTCLGKCVYYHVEMSLCVEHVSVIIVQ